MWSGRGLWRGGGCWGGRGWGLACCGGGICWGRGRGGGRGWGGGWGGGGKWLGGGGVLAGRCPGTRFVLDHCGGMDLKWWAAGADANARLMRKKWEEGIARLAERGNVVCKISG